MRCKLDGTTQPFIVPCEVEQGSLLVTGLSASPFEVVFSKVSVLNPQANPELTHYYYKGTVNLVIGNKTIAAPAGVTVTTDRKVPDQVVGAIELPNQYTKTFFEAYRN